MQRRWIALWYVQVACSGHSSNAPDSLLANDAALDATVSGTGFACDPHGLTQTYVKASNTRSYAMFGYQVAFSSDGQTLAIAAPFETSAATGIDGDQSDSTLHGAGAVYVFGRRAGNWTQLAYVKPSQTQRDMNFGWSIALSSDGNTLAVGAPYESNGGAVYIFYRSGSTWSQQAHVTASNADPSDAFGTSIALSATGDRLAVGAVGEASEATGVDGDQLNNSVPGAGAAYIFDRAADTWAQAAYLKGSHAYFHDGFGFSVALSANGDTLAVGQSQDCEGSPNCTGSAYIFVRSTSSWALQARLQPTTLTYGARFAYSLSLSADGNKLAAGAPHDALRGSVHMLQRTGSSWNETAIVSASSTTQGDELGEAVALSNDASTLAVGAPHQRSAAYGLCGDQLDQGARDSGAAYLFTASGASWTPQTFIKASNYTQYFGQSIATDGRGIAVGSPLESGGATGIDGDQQLQNAPVSGAAYVFE